MKRLLICTPSYATQGGVERIVQSLARALPRHGYEVIFALARGSRFHDPARFRAELGNVASVDVDGTSGSAYGRRHALAEVLRDVGPDVVLNARLFDLYPVLAAEKSTRADAPRFAVTVQAYEAEYLVDLGRWGAFVDVCVTSGNLVADAVQRFANLPAERVRSIPGGVAPARRTVVHRADAPLRIGYVGRLDDAQKRAGDLIAFVAELDARAIPYTLDVAGDGPAANALRSALPRASFLGWLTTDALYDRVYPELDVLVHFAAWEGITIAPREAMAHGVVPVISRFTGLAAEGQFVDEVNALTFDVGDVGAAADAVARLARDRELLERLARAARESQGGINSEEGAARAWAEAFDLALQLPPRIGATMPVVPRASGRLAFLPEALAEVIRRRRPMQHNDPGGEWPHWSGERDEALMQAIAEYAR